MKTTEIKQKLHHYIETAQEKKLKAIYMMVEDEIEAAYDYWNDDNFLAELQRREKSYLDGTARTYTPEQSVLRAKRSLKKLKSK